MKFTTDLEEIKAEVAKTWPGSSQEFQQGIVLIIQCAVQDHDAVESKEDGFIWPETLPLEHLVTRYIMGDGIYD